jgi:hypothetical protein
MSLLLLTGVCAACNFLLYVLVVAGGASHLTGGRASTSYQQKERQSRQGQE